jgi:hypothetical protein
MFFAAAGENKVPGQEPKAGPQLANFLPRLFDADYVTFDVIDVAGRVTRHERVDTTWIVLDTVQRREFLFAATARPSPVGDPFGSNKRTDHGVAENKEGFQQEYFRVRITRPIHEVARITDLLFSRRVLYGRRPTR